MQNPKAIKLNVKKVTKFSNSRLEYKKYKEYYKNM